MNLTRRGEEIEEAYYDWLTDMISGYKGHMSKLLRQLYMTPFRVTMLMDENRVGDGLTLRYRYAIHANLSNAAREMLKDIRPCSILEVMLGLALRFEEEYVVPPDGDILTGVSSTFNYMIRSLCLIDFDDAHYQPEIVQKILVRFMDRTNWPDGRGGLFYIPDAQEDMRQLELWDQLMRWYAYLQRCIQEGGGIL